MWWEFHRLMDLSPEQLVDEGAPIGMLEPVGALDEIGRTGKQTWRYAFPEQDYDVAREVYDPDEKAERPGDSPFTWGPATVSSIDLARRTVDLRRVAAARHPRAIVPLPWVRTTSHQDRLIEIAEWVLENGMDGDGPYLAARELLLRRPPRAGQAPGEALIRPGEIELDGARRLVARLDRSTLAVQGPPGSGKSYSGARMILTLLGQGKRVGITATSHKVIGNLLRKVLEAADGEGGDVRPIQHGPADQIVDDERVAHAKDASDVRSRLDDGRTNLAAGTAWLWTSGKLRDAVDVLFVDEAGQISLANVVAMTPATESVVLLGDPQQLDQPLQGSHPPGADRSALAHILGDDATMPADRGLFLATTWRLHPDLCAFTSEAFYEGRLEPEAHLSRQTVLGGSGPIEGTGPRFASSPSVDADSESPEEADAVAMLARSIVETETRWTNEDGVTRPVDWDDILIVAPYNAQVGAIARRLPPKARVGTVDKFQGQEAPISIYSLTTSSPELAPRGMDFLYSRNRLNVATSRARGVAIIVAAPDLFRVRARTPDQMRLANAFCRFAEMASAPATSVAVPAGPERGPPASAPAAEALTFGFD